MRETHTIRLEKILGISLTIRTLFKLLETSKELRSKVRELAAELPQNEGKGAGHE